MFAKIRMTTICLLSVIFLTASALNAGVLGAMLLPASASGAGDARAASLCPLTGAASVGPLAREWILVGWEKKPGDGPLDFREKLGKFYDYGANAEQAAYYDDFDPQRRLVHSAADYGAIWEPLFTALRSAQHGISFGPRLAYSNDIAVSTLQFVAKLTSADGKVTGIRTLSTLTWRCTAGGWKIMREHNSSQLVPAGQIDAALSAART
jgi:ketosteroid isomerase-like protein